NGREDIIGVKVPLCGAESDGVVAVGICDLFVVVRPEQVLVTARKRVWLERGRHRVGPLAMSGAVPELPTGDDLDDEMFAAVGERRLVGRDASRCAVKVVDGDAAAR